MNLIKKYIGIGALSCTLLTSCSDFLGVIPDDIATIENAFTMRTTAERYLYTCYSWMPTVNSISGSPEILCSDELWILSGGKFDTSAAFKYTTGGQNSNDPLMNIWDNRTFKALRDCNIFLDNIHKTPGMTDEEKELWKAEVKFLKAYYHFYLLRQYGAIPIIRTNLDPASDSETVKVERELADDCFAYIYELLDESETFLPDRYLSNDATMLGRIDKCILYATRALIKTTQASQLFNGNKLYAEMKNKAGVPFLNSEYSKQKWIDAAVACKAAIDLCDANGYELSQPKPISGKAYSEKALLEICLRNAHSSRSDDANEVIWRDTNRPCNTAIQSVSYPRGLHGYADYTELSVSSKMVDSYYTNNGVPINEDKNWNYDDRYQLQKTVQADKPYLIPNRNTARLNIDREPRYYASLLFDSGYLLGNNNLNEPGQEVKMLYAESGGCGLVMPFAYFVTGYGPKKLLHFESIFTKDKVSIKQYAWPLIRLSGLYLLYAEALNEVSRDEASSQQIDEILEYVDHVRQRAGLKEVKESWQNHSVYPDKFLSFAGRTEIIRRERMIELCFEGQRFWDVQRWMAGTEEYNHDIMAWNMYGRSAEEFYNPILVGQRTYSIKNCLWPIKEYSLIVNKNLIQNYYW